MTDHTEELLEISGFFAYDHLPKNLQEVSKPFGDLAQKAIEVSKPSHELLFGLRKLLEAKDCIVRAAKLKQDALKDQTK